MTLYGRLDCALCEDMRAALDELAPVFGFALRFVDIDDDPALRRRYDTLIPVLASDDRVICLHFLDVPALKAFLCAAAVGERQ